MKQLLILCISILLVSCGTKKISGTTKKTSKIEVSSPDDAIKTLIETDKENNLVYSVKNANTSLIEQSPLGLNIDSLNIGQGVEIIDMVKNTKNETYPWIGNQNEIHNHYNETKITLKHIKSNLTYFLEVRNYNNGTALRYIVPKKGTSTIYDEYTTFKLPEQTKVWYASGPFQYGWLQAFQERDMKDIKGELVAPPSTFQLAGNAGYLSITEASLYNFHGGLLLGKAPNELQMGFVENKGLFLEGKKIGLPDPKYYHDIKYNDSWQQEGEIVTPWRLVMYGKDLNALVNNNMVALVNPAPDKTLFPKGARTDWIKPGRSLWAWLSDRHNDRKKTPELYYEYIDQAHDLGIEYVTIDEGWYNWKDGKKNSWDIIKDLTTKAKKKNVGIWIWKSSSDRLGVPGLDDPKFRKDFFQKCSDADVKGIKVDFFHTENEYAVDVMEALMKEAAELKLMLVFHGVNKPTGEARTYPNFLAKEAIRGLECVGGEDSWAQGPPWTYHNTTFPFVRLLAGPADYTPMQFGKWKPKGTTIGHQIASPFIFTSPMMFFAADPEDILESKAKDLITDLPVSWDETYVLPQSAIGKIAAMARRKGDVWYLAILNGKDPVKTSLNLDFLEKGQYTIKIMTDIENGTDVSVKEKAINSIDALPVELLSGGGIVIKFVKN